MPSSKKYAMPRRIATHYLPTMLLMLGLSGAQAASLGPISVLSNLGEPLSAEIEIFDLSADEASELDVALASDMAFEKFGTTRSAQMESLKLQIVQQGRRRLIQLRTDKPLEQAIYGLLLELRTDNESTLAEFSVLPEKAMKSSEAVANGPPAAPVDAVKEGAAASAARDAVSTALGITEESRATTAQGTEDSVEVAGKGALNLALFDTSSLKQHLVVRGENLTIIARQLSVPDSSLDKFIAALYQDNPDAFIRQNLHYLKAGAVLALPTEESLGEIDEIAARKTIATQWQTFKSLLPPKDAASGEDNANRSSSRRLGAGGAQQSGSSGDRLTLAALKPSDSNSKTEEEAIAARKAAEEASERIRLLEKNILDLKSSVQPGKASENASENAGDAKETTSQAGLWGIIASPARDLMLQLATVLLLGALVVATFLRRNAK